MTAIALNLEQYRPSILDTLGQGMIKIAEGVEGGVKAFTDKVNVSTIAAMALKATVSFQIQLKTTTACESLRESAIFIDLAMEEYLKQQDFSKAERAELEEMRKAASERLPANVFGDAGVFPAENRIQATWQWLEKRDEQTQRGGEKQIISTFGEFLSKNQELNAALCGHAQRMWKDVSDIREVLCGYAARKKGGKEKVNDTEEVAAWESLAPVAKHLAERFMLMTDHPWSKTTLASEEHTVFKHATRKDPLVIERLKHARKKWPSGVAQLTGVNVVPRKDVVAAWVQNIAWLRGESDVIGALKNNEESRVHTHAVGRALVMVGRAHELQEWLIFSEAQAKRYGGAFDVNAKDEDGRTMMDMTMLHASKSEKKHMVNVLLAHGASMDVGGQRNQQTPQTVLMKTTAIGSVHEGWRWLDWLAEKGGIAKNHAAFEDDGRSMPMVAIEMGKLEWAVASLLRQPLDKLSVAGLPFERWWPHFEETNQKKIQGWVAEGKGALLDELGKMAGAGKRPQNMTSMDNSWVQDVTGASKRQSKIGR